MPNQLTLATQLGGVQHFLKRKGKALEFNKDKQTSAVLIMTNQLGSIQDLEELILNQCHCNGRKPHFPSPTHLRTYR